MSDEDGVHFVHEDDRSVTAVDEETGLARGGDTKSDALSQLAEALALHEDRGDPIQDRDAFLRDELGVEPTERIDDLPEFLQ